MPVKEIRASGIEALALATRLLQRARLADPLAGVWEAADIQWWWRVSRRSDSAERIFWMDHAGPVAGVMLTSWTDDAWQFDPVVVPGTTTPDLSHVWESAIHLVRQCGSQTIDVPITQDDDRLLALATKFGFSPGEGDFTAWMDARNAPQVVPLAEGFTINDRQVHKGAPHHMRKRSGDAVAERLAQCSLYDPSLDLVVETVDGTVAGYSLYWFDPVTKVGLVEPVRVEEEFQRRGLARAMLTIGIDRLVRRGARRIKISYESEAARKLYEGVGFRTTSAATWYRAPRSSDG